MSPTTAARGVGYELQSTGTARQTGYGNRLSKAWRIPFMARLQATRYPQPLPIHGKIIIDDGGGGLKSITEYN